MALIRPHSSSFMSLISSIFQIWTFIEFFFGSKIIKHNAYINKNWSMMKSYTYVLSILPNNVVKTKKIKKNKKKSKIKTQSKSRKICLKRWLKWKINIWNTNHHTSNGEIWMIHTHQYTKTHFWNYVQSFKKNTFFFFVRICYLHCNL